MGEHPDTSPEANSLADYIARELVDWLNTQPIPDDEAELLTELSSVAEILVATKAMTEALYDRRLALYQAGQARSPVVTQSRLATAAGVTEVSVGVVLSKARKGATDGQI